MASIVNIPVTTTGSAGSATGSASSPVTVTGLLHGLYLNYDGSAPITTQVQVTVPALGDLVLFDITGSDDMVYYPRVGTCSTSGIDDSGTTAAFLPNLTVLVTVSSSNALAPAVRVHLILV